PSAAKRSETSPSWSSNSLCSRKCARPSGTGWPSAPETRSTEPKFTPSAAKVRRNVGRWSTSTRRPLAAVPASSGSPSAFSGGTGGGAPRAEVHAQRREGAPERGRVVDQHARAAGGRARQQRFAQRVLERHELHQAALPSSRKTVSRRAEAATAATSSALARR